MSTNQENGRQFAGTSDAGDLNEALRVAILSAEHALQQEYLQWRLIELKGQHGGFVGANSITVVIEAIAETDQEKSDGPRAGAAGGPAVPQVLSGQVTKAEGMSFCMDAGRFRLNMSSGGQQASIRLAGANEETEEALEQFSHLDVQVVVTGYREYSVEGCEYFSAFYATAVTDLFKRLDVQIR